MKKGLLAFLILLLIFVGLRWNSAPFFSVKEYRCVQTGFLSDDYFSSIKTCVGQLVDQNYSAHTVIAHLKKNFPVLSKIVVAYRPLAVCVKMHAHKPVCCINDTFVLTTDNQLFPKNSFALNSLAPIAHITVAQECVIKTTSLISPLLRELPSDFHELYDLELMNEHCVYLTDKQDRQFTIVSSAVQRNIPILLAQCMSVKKNIGERKGFDKGVKWIVDTRFADYIVAYKV